MTMLHLLRLLVCAGALWALALSIVWSGGCSDTLTPRGAVKGRVTIGGQPMPKGRILFLPIAPNEGPTVSAAVANGEYALARHEGPLAGQNRVELEADLNLGFAIDDEAAFAQRGGRPLPSNPVPSEFNRNSKLVIDVKSSEQNTLDVAVPSPTHVTARPPY
jgi:hypothetical protein